MHHILKKANLSIGLAGNIGDSFAQQVAEKSYENYVLELSSFQLDGIDKFNSNIAILTNITPDHLDRYDYVFEQDDNHPVTVEMPRIDRNFYVSQRDGLNLQSLQ